MNMYVGEGEREGSAVGARQSNRMLLAVFAASRSLPVTHSSFSTTPHHIQTQAQHNMTTKEEKTKKKDKKRKRRKVREAERRMYGKERTGSQQQRARRPWTN
jgi:hypothetical protein